MPRIAKLLAGFQVFRATYFGQRPELYRDLVEHGQQPEVLIIACSDSRVDPALLLNAEPGELFVIRNVANLVPPHQPDEHYHGTSAAIEFAVRDLKVRNVVVLGHSRCGGIQALCRAAAGNPVDRTYINKWVNIAEGACPAHDHDGDTVTEQTARQTEQAAIAQSLENLKTFPWVKDRLDAGDLTLEGWWFDLDEGQLWAFDPDSRAFRMAQG